MSIDKTPAPKPDLARDERGAVLVVAVFMAVFLVGCLWYLVGIGDAAIYRQKMLDGSDSAAFTSAVYHARGMNIIAMMNLIMAAVLAVLVALKIAEIITWTVAAVAAVLCPFTGVACGVAETAANLGTELSVNIIPKVEKWVDKILKALSKGQVWVARLTPWVGAARGTIMATNYAPTVKGGMGLSMSMIPSDPRLGLPVEEEPFDKLCKRAGMVVGGLVFGWMPGGWGKFAGSLLGSVVSTFPSYFCGGSGMGNLYDGAKKTAKEQCKEAKKQFEDAHPNDTFNLKKCEQDAEKANLNKANQAANGGAFSGDGKTSKRVYSEAKNGDKYFQVYGLVMGDNDAMKKNADKRVEMPAWGKEKVNPGAIADTLEKIGFSEAEFYYDQVTPGKREWDDYAEDAMWNLRWRARLRRFRMPETDLFQGGVPDWVPGIPANLQNTGLNWLSTTLLGVPAPVVIH